MHCTNVYGSRSNCGQQKKAAELVVKNRVLSLPFRTAWIMPIYVAKYQNNSSLVRGGREEKCNTGTPRCYFAFIFWHQVQAEWGTSSLPAGTSNFNNLLQEEAKTTQRLAAASYPVCVLRLVRRRFGLHAAEDPAGAATTAELRENVDYVGRWQVSINLPNQHIETRAWIYPLGAAIFAEGFWDAAGSRETLARRRGWIMQRVSPKGDSCVLLLQ